MLKYSQMKEVCGSDEFKNYSWIAYVDDDFQNTMDDIKLLCDWKDTHSGNPPLKRSNDPEEKRLGIKLSYLKYLKSGKRGVYNPEYDIMMNQLGHPDLLDSVEFKQIAIQNITTICQWMKLHNDQPPSYGSKDPEEKLLGSKLSGIKSARYGKGDIEKRKIFYKEYIDVANSFGYKNLFDLIDYYQINCDDIKLIAEFYHKNRRYPSQNAKDTEEKRLGSKRSTLKKAKNGKGSGVWNDDYEKLAIKLKCPDMFQVMDHFNNTCDDIKLIAEFYHSNDKTYPSQSAKNKEEKRLGSKLSNLKQAKLGNGHHPIWNDDYEKLAIKLKCPHMFEPNNHFNNTCDDIRLIAEFYHNNGWYPTTTAKDKEEKRLGLKISHLKSAKSGASRMVWNIEYEKLAIKLKCPDMFESKRGNK